MNGKNNYNAKQSIKENKVDVILKSNNINNYRIIVIYKKIN